MMKNIKLIIVFFYCLFTSIGVQAQVETKRTEEIPKTEVVLPPVRLPEMPNAPKPLANAEPVAETALAQDPEKNQRPVETEKPNFSLLEFKEPEIPGGEEGKKIMAGKATRPAPEKNNHSTIDPNAVQVVRHPKIKPGEQQQINTKKKENE